jgi:predicted ATP-grasp superfamily ATP-dependent carboligase
MLAKKHVNRAIVIGTDNHNSLGVVRSLGKMGVPVDLIVVTADTSKKTAVEYSRYIKSSYRIKDIHNELI